MPSGSMYPVVVCELGDGQPVHPVVLVVVDVEPKILLQSLVDTLYLTIGLRVVGCGRVVLDA